MKRFTDTEKWSDTWFMNLPHQFKAVWLLAVDKCDHAGIFEANARLICFLIGAEISIPDFLTACNGRILEFKPDKWFIKPFIKFQYGMELNPENSAHAGVIKRLKEHGLDCPVPIKGSEGAPKGLPKTLKGSKDKDKDKDKEADTILPTIYGQIDARAGAMFGRTTPATVYAEQSALSEISRRPDAINELAEIEVFHRKPQNYFPQSLQKLLSNWQETLDRARTHDERKKKNANDKPTGEKRIDRSVGTANEGVANQYKGLVHMAKT